MNTRDRGARKLTADDERLVADVAARLAPTVPPVPDEAGYATFFTVSMQLHPANVEQVALRWHRLQPRERDAYRGGALAAIEWNHRKEHQRDPVGDLILDLESCEGAVRAGAVYLSDEARLELHGALARLAIALIDTAGAR